LDDLDRMARELAAERVAFDLEFGAILRKLKRHRVWMVLGYPSFEEYVRERLGVSIRTVRQRIWLERRMDELPELRDALADGTLTYTKALFVAKDASPEDVTERILLAASTTVQQTERESDAEESRQNRAAGVIRLWGPRDTFETVSMAIVACQRMYRERGESISAGEALARMADYATAVWREEVKRERRRHQRKRREVMGRNGGYCAFPGCTRPAEHDHHVRYRSRGGSDDASNRIPLCAAHHLRSIHRGWAEVSGRAGERLTWRFGSGERFVTLGDDDVVRIG
jgi:hypothetical protein